MSVDELTERLSRRVANGITRKSFLGRMGAGLVAVGGGALAVEVPQALADSCGCANSGHSTNCSPLSSCPAGTCTCGAWSMCEPACAPFLRSYQDCCGSCGQISCGSDGYPSCCYTHPYGSNCNGFSKVQCRAIYCVGIRVC